jgi:predicted GH43/DUF377 family glycosyl hydrolase
MWLDKSPNVSNIPTKYVPYVDTWKRMNKDWKIKIWYTEDIIELLDKNFSTREKEFWYNLEPHLCKCDFARFLVIHAHGGLYVDLDFICRKNITPLIGENTSLFFKELPEHLYFIVPQIYVGIFYAVKGLPFIRGFIDYVMTNYSKSPRVTHNGVLENTGPIALARYYQISPYSIVIGNSCDIGPYTDKQTTSKACATDDSYAYTLWKDGSTTIPEKGDEGKVYPLTSDNKLPDISHGILVLLAVLTVLMFALTIVLTTVLRKKWILVFACISLALLAISIGRHYHRNDLNNKEQLAGITTKSTEVFPINLMMPHPIPAKLINEKYTYYNPSLAKIKGQKYIWIRKSSYFLCGQGSTTDGNVNQHLFGKLTDSNDLMLETLTHFFLPKDINIWKRSPYKHFPNEPAKYFGVEDIRLTYDEERDILLLTGTYPFISRTSASMKAALYYAELDYTSATVSNEKILTPDFDHLDKHVKNIVPVFKGKKLYIIHTLYPFVLCEIHHNTNTYGIVKEIKYELPFKIDPQNHFVSGGSSLLPIGDFYLGIGHLTHSSPRSYKHFFYLLDKDCHIISYTREPFCIDKETCWIQFAIGTVIEDNSVLVSYGENDCHAKLHIYSLSSIFAAMSSINQTPCGTLKLGEDRPWCCILHMFMTLLGVHYAFEDAGIVHWIDFGTLLGAVRGKEVIKHTNDVDLSIMATNKEDAIMALEKHMGNTHDIRQVNAKDDKKKGKMGYILVTDKQYPGISLDIALRIEHNDKLYDGHVGDKNPINVSDTFPLSQTEIYGFMFPSPGHTHSVLTNYYGPNYMTPRRYQHSGDSEDDMSRRGS